MGTQKIWAILNTWWNKLWASLKCHVLWVEYPGYGICFRQRKNSQEINRRALRVYQFLTHEFGYKEKDIIIFGRSVGSGPAFQLASKTKPALLLLMSAYTSIKNVARDICRCAKCTIKERFNSLAAVKHIIWPFFLIHGHGDTVIRAEHSRALYEEGVKHDKVWDVKIQVNMDHNNFNFRNDIVEPIREFMYANNISCKTKSRMSDSLKYCKLYAYEDLAKVPSEYNREFLYERLHAKQTKCCCTIF